MNRSSIMSRRHAIGALALAPLSGAINDGHATSQVKRVSFVLIHGAWHGGWCWKKLTPLLRARGHEVATPTLTGLGERAHLLTADVDLDTHIKDVTSVLEYEDLESVVLVGHSYGGMVIAGAADKAGPRIAQLVYLDAFLPENGKSLRDYAGQLPPTSADGWRVPPPGGPAGWGVTDPRDTAWMNDRLGPQPLKTFTQPVQLSAGTLPATKQAFIQCSAAPFFAEAGERAKRQGFRYRALLSAGHDAMISQPRQLASLLLGLL